MFRVRIIRNVAVAANTGIGRIPLRRTGRIGYHRRVGMFAGGFDNAIHVRIGMVASIAGIAVKTVHKTGRFDGRFYVVMTQGFAVGKRCALVSAKGTMFCVRIRIFTICRRNKPFFRNGCFPLMVAQITAVECFRACRAAGFTGFVVDSKRLTGRFGHQIFRIRVAHPNMVRHRAVGKGFRTCRSAILTGFVVHRERRTGCFGYHILRIRFFFPSMYVFGVIAVGNVAFRPRVFGCSAFRCCAFRRVAFGRHASCVTPFPKQAAHIARCHPNHSRSAHKRAHQRD